jgi:hypothetical protein|tara:strand:- start:252 stop:446 length:195 start_codon:yes stop_codon:yes gene_type:complete
MRKAFFEMKDENTSKINEEILTWTYRKDQGNIAKAKTLEIETIFSADDDVSQRRERHQLWYAQR